MQLLEIITSIYCRSGFRDIDQIMSECPHLEERERESKNKDPLW